MAKNEQKLNNKISSELKKYGILKDAFLSIHKSEEKVMKARIENYEKINTIKENDNIQLKDIYTEFINDMKSLEEENRKRHLAKIWDLILPATECYPQILKDRKKELDNLIKIRKNKEKMQKSKEKAQINKDANEEQKLNAELARQTDEEKKQGETLEKKIMKFESDRIVDNKFLFTCLL